MDVSLFSSPVLTLSEHDTIHEVLVLMQTNFVKRIVIVRDRKPIGIVTERDINRFLENDRTRRALDEIQIREIMKRNPITIQADQANHFEQCATRMITFRVGSIIITDDNGDLAGITTKTDITAAYAATYSGKYRVKDYMTDRVITCRDSDLLHYALEILSKNDVSRLAATDSGGKLRGILTTNTFLRHSQYFKTTSKTRNYLLTTEMQDSRIVSDLIGNEVLTVEPDDDLARAASLMIKNKIGGIPVVNGKDLKLVGIISKFDVVRAYSNVVPHEKIIKEYRTFP